MFEHDTTLEKALHFSRFDQFDLLSTVSGHPILLEEREWQTVEHYFQAQIVGNKNTANKICSTTDPKLAFKIGNAWFTRKRKDWKKLRRVLMTRGLYTKCMMYPNVKQTILATDDQLIIETSAYDHYWGIGRDQRGANMLGKIWMDIRQKLREEQKDQFSNS